MKAVLVERAAEGKTRLVWGETADPTDPTVDSTPDQKSGSKMQRASQGQVLIEVRAAGVNRADLLQRAGRYAPPDGVSSIMGLEVAGEILAVGEDVKDFQKGMPVVALLAGGGYAERVAVDARCVLPLPKGLSFVQGAAVVEAGATVWLNLFELARFGRGERLFVHGGTSGIGCMAIQAAKMMGASWVGVTVANDAKRAVATMLGADLAVLYPTEDFAAATKIATQSSRSDRLDGANGSYDVTSEGYAREGESGVDVVIDIVGAPYLSRNLEILRQDGRLVQLATMLGHRADGVDLAMLMRKRIMWIGSTLRHRGIESKKAVLQRMYNELWPALESGRIRMPIHATMPMDQAEAAHELMQSGHHIGKIVLTRD